MRAVMIAIAGMGVALSACAAVPMSQERAARICREEARLADGVATDVGIGAGSGGVVAEGAVTITSRIFDPQSELEAFEACMDRVLSGGRASVGTTVGITLGGST